MNQKEWLKQAAYDMGTADVMFKNKRYFYAVFMCHLSIEKALKGLYQEKLTALPPKTHNLVYLLNAVSIKPPDDIGRFIVKLNEASVATRYPEEIKELSKSYTQPIVKGIIKSSKEALKWIKTQF
ncbi:MAG: DNA-binding protein [Syntrophus sp. (in: bacteria)]|nr:DNA-binding protein [Syntrophus sp. (in: bacteria)]